MSDLTRRDRLPKKGEKGPAAVARVAWCNHKVQPLPVSGGSLHHHWIIVLNGPGGLSACAYPSRLKLSQSMFFFFFILPAVASHNVLINMIDLHRYADGPRIENVGIKVVSGLADRGFARKSQI